MRTPALTTNAESAHIDRTRSTSTVSADIAALLKFSHQEKTCCDCLSRERCPVSRQMSAEPGSQAVVVSGSRVLEQGEHMFQENHAAEALYIVKSGSAKVWWTLLTVRISERSSRRPRERAAASKSTDTSAVSKLICRMRNSE